MIFTTDQISLAVQYWGKKGDGAIEGEVISRQASKLVDVWASALYDKRSEVDLTHDGHRCQLVVEALKAFGV